MIYLIDLLKIKRIIQDIWIIKGYAEIKESNIFSITIILNYRRNYKNSQNI
jgi:hypothetical protein